MNALENITERIKTDAKKKAKQHLDEANKKAQEILNKAKSELEREKKAMEQETEKTISIQRSRAISEAKLEARRIKLGAKEEVIKKAFEDATAQLKNLDPVLNERYLRNAVKNAVSLLGSDVEVLCNSSDASLVMRIASEINPQITVKSQGVNYLGGAVIRAKDGSASVDSRFEGVLERLRTDLRKEIADKLFPRAKENVKEE